MVSYSSQRGNGFRLKEGRFILDIWKKSFIIRVGKHWHRLTREMVDALGDIQSQSGQGTEQPDIAVGIPVSCRGVGLGDL